jgi:hypothetical protein
MLDPHIQVHSTATITSAFFIPFICLFQRLHSGPNGLQAAIERTAIHAPGFRFEVRAGEMRRKLVSLSHPMAGQGRITRIARWGRKAGGVDSRLEIDGPSKAMLLSGKERQEQKKSEEFCSQLLRVYFMSSISWCDADFGLYMHAYMLYALM